MSIAQNPRSSSSKHRTVRLLFGLALLITLSSCNLPTTGVQETATIGIDQVTPTKGETELPTLTDTPEATATITSTATATFTPEPTATATPVIDFEIPDAPSNADPVVWREQYIDGMLTNGYLRLKV